MTLLTMSGGRRKSRRSRRRSTSRPPSTSRRRSTSRRHPDLSRAIQAQSGFPLENPSTEIGSLFRKYEPDSPNAKSLLSGREHPLEQHSSEANLDPYLRQLLEETNKLVSTVSTSKEAKEYPTPQRGGMNGFPGLGPFMGISNQRTSVLSPYQTMEEARRRHSYEIPADTLDEALDAKKPEYYLLQDERGLDPNKQFLTVMYQPEEEKSTGPSTAASAPVAAASTGPSAAASAPASAAASTGPSAAASAPAPAPTQSENITKAQNLINKIENQAIKNVAQDALNKLREVAMKNQKLVDDFLGEILGDKNKELMAMDLKEKYLEELNKNIENDENKITNAEILLLLNNLRGKGTE